MRTVLFICVCVLATLLLLDNGQAAKQLKPPCQVGGLARYNVTFHALWSKQDFPKQYPLFRPPAQWTKMLGRAHSRFYVLWRKGWRSTTALKKFAELGQSTLLDKQTQGQDGIIDDFSLPAIAAGTGVTSATFFVNSWHSKVSLVSRIVPSPDWFIGVDSLDLCKDGTWVNGIEVDLHPYDAGTDRGFTFTAPNWATYPAEPISEITSQMPNHPANSFFYPEREANPPIGRLEFSRLSVFKYHSGDNGQAEYLIEASQAKAKQDIKEQEEDSGDVGVQENKVGGDLGLLKGYTRTAPADGMAPFFRTFSTLGQKSSSSKLTQVKISSSGDEKEDDINYLPKKETKSRKHHKSRKLKTRKHGKGKFHGKVHCEISNWSEWSACSKTCGFGQRSRSREVIRKPVNYGRPCPLLHEEETCGSMRTCRWNHFSSWSLA